MYSTILAANEFREFLRFFPLDKRADYAQYKLAIASSKQILGPERDPRRWPGALARREGAVWILDEAAASRLPGR